MLQYYCTPSEDSHDSLMYTMVLNDYHIHTVYHGIAIFNLTFHKEMALNQHIFFFIQIFLDSL